MTDTNKIREEIERLRKEINYHNYLYYVKHAPIISDEEFDFLLKKLQKLEEEYPQFDDPNSPTHKVGSDITGMFKVYEHSSFMGSIDNVYNFNEFLEFHRRTGNSIGSDFSYVIEPKIDGVAISLIYKDGSLFRSLTRGDGYRGEDVTQNVRMVRGVPLYLIDCPDDMKNIEVRGEIYFSKERFNQIKEDYGFSNPRNAAAGTLKLLDPREVQNRGLSLLIHSPAVLPDRIKTHYDALQELNRIGFPVSPIVKIAHSAEDVQNIYEYFEENREELPFEIDGIVIKVNEFVYQRKLGYTAKGPKWAIAFKFPSKKKETILLSVSWQVGRTGAVTPVGNLEPVEIGGVIVKRVTLHNADEIERLDLHINDTVLVERSGDVIPHIIGVIKEKRPDNARKVEIPDHCPVCGSNLVKLPDEVVIRCINPSCSAQIKRRIEHFASRDAMDIRGLGEKVVEFLVNKGSVKSIPDIYTLTSEVFEGEEGWGEKSINNLLSAIEDSKKREFYRLIYGLGIRYVGIVAAKDLSDHFKSMDKLMNATIDELKSVPGIGEIASYSIYKFFRLKENIEMVNRLKEYGINMKNETSNTEGPLKGEVWVITGKLTKMSRDEAHDFIIKLGGKVTTSVSSKVTGLVVGEKPGSKLKKAEKLGIRIIKEDEFYRLLKESGIGI